MRPEFRVEQIGRHCRTENHHIVKALFTKQAFQKTFETSAGKTSGRDSFAFHHRPSTPDQLGQWANKLEMTVPARQLAHRVKMGKIASVVHKTAQMHGALGGHMLEQGMGTDLVPLVWRIGEAVAKKQNVAWYCHESRPILYTDAMLDH